MYIGILHHGLTTPESYHIRVETPIDLPYSFGLYSDITRQTHLKSRHVPALCPAWIIADEFQYAEGLNTGVWAIIYRIHLLHSSTPPYFIGISGTPIENSPNDVAGPLTALKDRTLEGYDKNDYEADPHGTCLGTCLGDLLAFTKRFKEANKKAPKEGTILR
ncbi:hypothetical protein XANCAGTX0491_003345 [Xanthoria calcicola]